MSHTDARYRFEEISPHTVCNHLGTCNFDTMIITPCVSRDICQVSHVRRQMSGVTCQVSNSTSNFKTVMAKVDLLPPVTCHMSCVTYHI